MSLAETLRHRDGAVRLRARWVLPIHLPPIEDGEVVVEGGRIIQVGKASGSAQIDLGLCAILPGFVNVHAHLEYTLLRGLLEDLAFFPWIRALTALKAFLSRDDWIVSATLGAAEMLSAGVTTVADASDAGATVAALIAAGMRGIVYREVFGIEAAPETAQVVGLLGRRLEEMRQQIERTGADERVAVGISPHAPYTVRPDLFAPLAAMGERQTIHLAESPAEAALFAEGSGPFAAMFAARGIDFIPRAPSPIAHAASCGAFDAPTLAVHCVHATDHDARLLADRGVAVAHCPRSNGKLAAGIAPVRALRAAGVRVGLGTDSLMTANSADFFEEMRAAVYGARAREKDPQALSARQALRMATEDGAAALGLEKETGTLAPGKRADLCAVRLDGLHLFPASQDEVEAALVYSARASDVFLTMVGGEVLYESGSWTRLETGRLRASAGAARRRLRTEGGKILVQT